MNEKKEDKVYRFKSIDGKYILATRVNPEGDFFEKYFKPLKEEAEQ